MLSLFVNGSLHIIQLPAQLIFLIGLALLSGQQLTKTFKAETLLFSLSLISGLITNYMYPFNWDESRFLLSLSLAISLLTLLALNVPYTITRLILISSSFLLGLTFKPLLLPGFSLLKIISSYLGILTSTLLLFSILLIVAFYLRAWWQGIILRVLSSWIAAIALLVLALSFTTGR